MFRLLSVAIFRECQYFSVICYGEVMNGSRPLNIHVRSYIKIMLIKSSGKVKQFL